MVDEANEIQIPREDPLKLTSRQTWLCSHLDNLNVMKSFCPTAIPSVLLRGAIYLTQDSIRISNPDWMAQAAHSLREIMYGFVPIRHTKTKIDFELGDTVEISEVEQTRRNQIADLLRVFQDSENAEKLALDLNDLYLIFTNISHHFRDNEKLEDIRRKMTRLGILDLDPSVIVTESVFEQLLSRLETAWVDSIPQQLKIHDFIDSLLSNDPESTNIGLVRVVLDFNPDARQYFYSKANAQWLDWFWSNGFLDVIKSKETNPTQFVFPLPELNYLARIAEIDPEHVVDILLDTPVSMETFNTEVVDQFLRICGGLSADQISRVVTKIRDEQWVLLMGKSNRWGFDYEKMLQTLIDAKDFKSTLVLAEAILVVRPKVDFEKFARHPTSDRPFYFDDLSQTEVFTHLAKLSDEFLEQALALVLKVMATVILLGDKSKSGKVFPIDDVFHLFDVDFFTLELGDEDLVSYEKDFRELAAVVKTLTNRLIGQTCEYPQIVCELYEKYIQPMPDSRAMWRLKLSILSMCPDVFRDELKKSFFRLFENRNYYELVSGVEYQKALRSGFAALSDGDRREYVKQVLIYFGDDTNDADDQHWRKTAGWRVLSSICKFLLAEESARCEQIFGTKCDPNYEPETEIGDIIGGIVAPRGPISKEEFETLPIDEIARKLRSEWTPEKLSEQDSSHDFLSPLNADGVGELLRADISKRFHDYISNSDLFFERESLSQHYTNSFLRGVLEALRVNKGEISDANLGNLVNLFIKIKESDEAKAFDNTKGVGDAYGGWLSSWSAVHSSLADVLQILLSGGRSNVYFDFPKHREDLFTVVSYLLSYPDLVPADEIIESSRMKTKSSGSDENLIIDPHSMAMSSVRGRAFQAFVLFVHMDGQKFSETDSQKISADAKVLYETILRNEKTRALMFMFGWNLRFFYFRDTKWIHGLLSEIFPVESNKRHLYTAAWEGYLSTATLYKELFFDPKIQELYERGLALTDADFPRQQHAGDPDERIAIHIALAFMHYPEFGFEHDLFKQFWDIENLARHSEFISFIGRHTISRESTEELKKRNKVNIDKVEKFWEWALKNCKPEVLTSFGSWINSEYGVFDIKWLAQHSRQTLEKTNGFLEWDFGLMRSLMAFAKEAPEDTLAILRAHLLEEVAKREPVRTWFHMDSEVFDVFKELYKNESVREEVRALINDLLPYRSPLFWGLKSVLEINGN